MAAHVAMIRTDRVFQVLGACALLGGFVCKKLCDPQGQRLRQVLPVAWVHVPKTGSTYMNTVLHLPGVCPGIPKDLLLCDDWNPDCNALLFAYVAGGPVGMNKPPVICAAGVSRFCTHDGFDTEYLSGMKGHGFIMLRQAEQRIMSGYYNVLFNTTDRHGWKPEWGEPSILEYAMAVQGTAVKMLARDGDIFQFGRGPPPLPGETELAVSRLREGFAFVGISEEHELSVCLLHKMFGNSCKPQELKRFHTSKNASNAAYDTSGLQGFRDVHDGALYDEGLQIFRENLQHYGATPTECAQCFSEAGLGSEQLSHVGKAVGLASLGGVAGPSSPS